ncbi:hypothetical protein DVH24_009039 [Malus domestica]|uniref:Uncharacterized protein n=1 Tax=Malus domestica TaxID=3750 RepID=A0A498JN86_MALDO|nr:hypothetical protein DVH24_009039 [Malus domestica]
MFTRCSKEDLREEVWYPNLFLDEPISIHDVLGPSSALVPSDVNQGWDIILSPACDSNSNMVFDVSDAKNMVDWSRIILLLGSKGFVSFVVGLNPILDRCSGISCAAMASWACRAPYKAADSRILIVVYKMEYKRIAFSASELVRNGQGNSLETGSLISISVPGQSSEASSNACLLDSAKVTGVSVQVLTEELCSIFLITACNFRV